jgi:hypothetical protein
VGNQPFQLRFSAVRCKVGDLWFEGTHHVVGGVNDVGAKIENMRGILPQVGREFAGVWVQSDAQQRLMRSLGGGELFQKSHGPL